MCLHLKTFSNFVGKPTVYVTLKNGFGFLIRYMKRKPVSVSFISDKPEDSEMRFRANLFMFMPWRRKTNRKDPGSLRYEEIDLILKNGFETYRESWKHYIAKHKNADWTKQFYAAEAIRKAEFLGNLIAKVVAEEKNEEKEKDTSSQERGI